MRLLQLAFLGESDPNFPWEKFPLGQQSIQNTRTLPVQLSFLGPGTFSVWFSYLCLNSGLFTQNRVRFCMCNFSRTYVNSCLCNAPCHPGSCTLTSGFRGCIDSENQLPAVNVPCLKVRTNYHAKCRVALTFDHYHCNLKSWHSMHFCTTPPP